MAKKEECKREVNLTAMEYFLSDVFNNYLITKNHVETKTNWLLGISGFIMTICLPLIINKDSAINYFAIMIICFSAFICFIMCLLSFELPNWLLTKPHRDGGVMFFNTERTITPEEIHKKLMSIKTREALFEEYAINIYNVVERNIKVKNRLFKSACKILFTGIILGFITTIIALAIHLK